jgi:probable HAF family extracellular repeat protein
MSFTRLAARPLMAAALYFGAACAHAGEVIPLGEGEQFSFAAYNDPALSTVATDLDRHGNILGYYFRIGHPQQVRGFIRDRDGGYRDLVNDLPGAIDTWPMAMNDRGQIVGYSHTTSGRRLAWSYDPSGQMFSEIQSLAGTDTTAFDINEAGVIVGSVRNRYSRVGNRGFVRQTDGSTTIIKYPGAKNTCVYSVNDLGQIAGAFSTEAWYYSNCEPYSAIDSPFIGDPQGKLQHVVAPLPDSRYSNTREFAARTLSNDGDFASGCRLEYYATGCFYSAAEQKTQSLESLYQGGSSYAGVLGIKDDYLVGYRGATSGSQRGWVGRQKDLTRDCTKRRDSPCYPRD